MNGAASLVATAIGAGVEVCFANPGTTELPLVTALDDVPGIRPVLTLFEGVASGAADGYGRLTGQPALTLLHLGPGFSNAAANLHNARRARTPVLSVVGDQARWHRRVDAPLTSDLETLARPVSVWVRSSARAADLARDLTDGLRASLTAPGPATLLVPADCQWDPAPEPAPAKPVRVDRPRVGDHAVTATAEVLRSGRPAALLLGGQLPERTVRLAAQIAETTGAGLLVEAFPVRLDRGAGRPAPARLGYFPERAVAALSAYADLVLVGADSPVTFFGYRGVPSSEVPEGTRVSTLATPTEDTVDALERLADALPTGGTSRRSTGSDRPIPPTGRLDPETLGAAIACSQPEGAVIVDEGLTSGLAYFAQAATAAPHTYLGHVGGAIGQGLPLTVGAAIAAPDRPVLAVQADGSGLYTVQALWTQARESLDVTTVICANRSYRILQAELLRDGSSPQAPASAALTTIDRPPVDWVAVARGFGVPAERVERAEDLTAALGRAVAEPGPHLVEAVLSDDRGGRR